MNIQLTRLDSGSNKTYLPFRVVSGHHPNSLSEAHEAKAARDLVASVNAEIDRLESWVTWIAAHDQSSQDLNPQPGKVAILGAHYNGQSVDGYADFQTTSGKQLVAKQAVEKAELKVNGASQEHYRRNGDSIEAYVHQNGTDTGFLISGSYGGACTIKKTQP